MITSGSELHGRLDGVIYVVGKQFKDSGENLLFHAVAKRGNDERPVIVKTPKDLVNEWIRCVFFRECQISRSLLALHEPRIIKAYDSGESDDDSPFLVLELLDSRLRPLSQEFEAGRTAIHKDILVVLGTQFAKIFERIHRMGALHRDITLNNLLVDSTLQPENPEAVKVIDFGCSCLINDDPFAESEIHLLSTSGRVGNPAVLSPEIVDGKSWGSVQSEIYALGTVLLTIHLSESPVCLLTANQRRFVEKSWGTTIPMTAPSIGWLFDRANTPLNLQAALLKAVAEDPADRYSSMEEFAKALESLR